MKRRLLSTCSLLAVCLLSIGCAKSSSVATANAGSGASASANDAPPPDINSSFKDPEADPQRWIDQFERESREVYALQYEIVEAADLKLGERVADIGAGTGLFIPRFLEAVGPVGKVYAVDISPALIEHMQQRFADQDGIEVVLSKEKSAELEEGSVDVVFTCDTYHHFTYYQEMLASIHRALSPGGRLLILDFVREPGISPEWILDHVRANQAQVIEEVEAAGFRLDRLLEAGLTENYYLQFIRLDASSTAAARSPD